MADEIEFPQGLMARELGPKAPDFVKAKLLIKRTELITWLTGKNDDWINIDVKRSKGGKLYCSVDQWTPDQGDVNAKGIDNARQQAQAPTHPDVDDDDIPF